MTETVTRPAALPDEELVARVAAGDLALFEELMRRYNQRLYRVARAIVKDEDEAEDVVQQAYIQAYTHLGQFAGRSQFSTWLTRIAIHEALSRRRKLRGDWGSTEPDEELMSRAVPAPPDPERLAYASELRALLESSIDALPESYRLVFMCREVEGLSTAETAGALELGEEAIKTRLHRARSMLREELFSRAGVSCASAFAFQAPRCDAIVQRVMGRLSTLSVPELPRG